MLIPNRHGSSNSYRYGFQGQEKDDELKGEGNSLNYTFRMHDPRVGRFFAPDPLEKEYPWYTPYQFSGNKVIAYRELEGLEELISIIPKDTGQPNILTVTGKQVVMYVIAQGLEKTSKGTNKLTYKIAFEELASGKLRASNGKTYNQSVLLKKDLTLIDGTIIKNVTIGRNIGNNKKKYNTTKGINQIEAFRPNYLKKVSEGAKMAGNIIDVATWIDSEKGEINGNGALSSGVSTIVALKGGNLAGLAVSIILSINEDEIGKMNSEFKSKMIEDMTASYSLEKTQNVLKHNLFGDFQLHYLTTDSINQFLNGSIKDLEELYKFESKVDNPNAKMGALLIQTGETNDKVYIHSVYIPDSK